MKTVTSFTLNLAAAVLLVIAGATIAVAGEDTCAGSGATIGATCTPLTNTSSGSSDNTAVGFDALLLTTGFNNTATGANALAGNTTGNGNTAAGVAALLSNTTGGGNTATGMQALENNTTGISNTATGSLALRANTTGIYNTATGLSSLQSNSTGNNNTAIGLDALTGNNTGNNNTASGFAALFTNQTGDFNTATGDEALEFNTTGESNTATGADALLDNTTGNSNIGIGSNAGANLTTGDNNIDIGNEGVAAESNTIRVGTQGTQTDTFIAGIFNGPTIKKGCVVVVDNTGLLGCAKSSARYKRDVRDMGEASDKLMKLRPVTFRYKADSTSIQQYGLIAEEVEKVYPELVIDGADGRAETVAYQVLPAMLLNEVQKQARADQRLARQLAQKDAQIAALRRQLVALEKKNSQIDALAERLDALERQARASRPDRLAAALR